MLQSMNDCLHILIASPLNSTCKEVQFATSETVEPYTPQAIVQVERNTNPPRQFVEITNLLKNLKLSRFGGEEKERNEGAVNMFLHKWTNIHNLKCSLKEVRSIKASL